MSTYPSNCTINHQSIRPTTNVSTTQSPGQPLADPHSQLTTAPHIYQSTHSLQHSAKIAIQSISLQNYPSNYPTKHWSVKVITYININSHTHPTSWHTCPYNHPISHPVTHIHSYIHLINSTSIILISVPCISYYFVQWPTNSQLIDILSHSSYMFRHSFVILREFLVSTLLSYTSISSAVVGNII